MWPFKRKYLPIRVEPASILQVRSGDTLAVVVPTQWNGDMIRQYAGYAEAAWLPKLPSGVGLIFITSDHAPVVIRGSEKEPHEPTSTLKHRATCASEGDPATCLCRTTRWVASDFGDAP